MMSNFKSAAILHLLTKTSYENVLIINGWPEFNSIVNIHGDNIYEITNQMLLDEVLVTSNSFDLIIAFSPNQAAFDFIKSNKELSSSEMIFICHSNISYYSDSVSAYKSLIGITNQTLNICQLKNNIFNFSQNHKIFQYYIFPDVMEPELILMQSDFNQYRRYWSWKEGSQKRSFISSLIEYFFVTFLRSSLLTPFTVMKVD